MSHVITVAAAVILNDQQQTLLVRKKHTQSFMHVGGKLESHESPEHALTREAFEETGCELNIISYIGKYQTLAANEKDHLLISHLYHAELVGEPKIQAELADMRWVNLDDDSIMLAPLTKEISIPWLRAHVMALG